MSNNSQQAYLFSWLGAEESYIPHLCFVRPNFGFWSLLLTKFTFGQDGKKRKENHANKVTKIPKTKRWDEQNIDYISSIWVKC